jgi:hypothetical protein
MIAVAERSISAALAARQEPVGSGEAAEIDQPFCTMPA